MDTHNRELNIGLSPLVDVLHPLVVRVKAVGGQADDLDAAVGKVGLTARDLSELSRANRGEVIRVRKEDRLQKTSVRGLLWRRRAQRTQESPIQSWNLMGPWVVSAWKSGAMAPSLKEGMIDQETRDGVGSRRVGR